jgi:O-antigen ligase
MPLLLRPHFGNGHSDPKWLLFFALGAVVALGALLRPTSSLRIARWQLPYFAFLAFELASFGPQANLGVFLWAAASTLTCALLSVWIANEDFDPDSPAIVLLLAAVVVIVCALAMILFRVEWGAPGFGSTIGSKNTVSVWLAQVLPLVLALAARAKRAPRLVHLLVVVVGAMSVWVILANRTRSAWLMLIVEGLFFFALHVRRRDAMGRTLERFVACVVLGVVLLFAVPNKLSWQSKTPYSDSVASLASLEKSSGRDKLWRVGLEMVRAHPIRGASAGNYAVSMRAYVAPSGIDPKVLGFLQPDLPIFNDYLQALIELGILGGLALLVIAFGLPALAFRKIWRSRGDPSWAPFCVVSCVAVAADALVDYPFNRAETLLVYTAALAIAFRGAETQPWFLPPRWLERTGQLVALTALLAITTSSFASFEIRRSAARDPGGDHDVDLAYRLWPWDARWDVGQVQWYLRNHRLDGARGYARDRRHDWPDDPETGLGLALVEIQDKDFEAAKASYARAVVEVRGGRCYAKGYSSYLTAVMVLENAITLPAAALRSCRSAVP